MSFIIPNILPIKNQSLESKIQIHLDDLTKPKGSLGRLEEFAMQYCLCKSTEHASLKKMEMYTFAGDHGITEEGVCPFPKEVTPQMVLNMVGGGAAVSVMCKRAGVKYSVVDMGVDFDFPISENLINCKVGRGTNNFHTQPAMDDAQCDCALQKGYDLAERSNADLVGIGEMGIGNSSSASALYSLLLDMDAEMTVGAGTGSAGPMLEHKRSIISKSVALHKSEWNKTAFDALRRVGGFEIAGMAGFILGAAVKKIPVVIDGFIASSAALVALKMNPNVKDYLFFAHSSAEKFHKDFLKYFEIRSILDLDMRLGEGTGAVLGMQIIDQALALYNEMATFSNAGVERGKDKE